MMRHRFVPAAALVFVMCGSAAAQPAFTVEEMLKLKRISDPMRMPAQVFQEDRLGRGQPGGD